MLTTALLSLGPIGCAAATAKSGGGAPKPGLWTGTTVGTQVTRFTFVVKGSKMTKFDAPSIGCNSYPTGFITQTITFPKAIAIHGGRFTGSRHPVKGATDTLKGTFSGASAAKGTLVQAGVCDTGRLNWIARPGHTPPRPEQVPPPACSATACTATDGLKLHVTTVDTTLTSLQPAGLPSYINDVDQALAATGGVQVDLTATNPTNAAISIEPVAQFTLKDGAANYIKAQDDSDSYVTTTDGGGQTSNCVTAKCGVCDNDLVTVPPHGSSPITTCFVDAQQNRRDMTLLFNYPQTYATIPLG